jgi:uncharacterized membrane protein YvbJ
MSYITCPKCGRQISDIVRRCPGCNCDHAAFSKKIKNQKSSWRSDKASPFDWIKLLAAAGAVAALIFFYGENIFPVIISAAVTMFGMVGDIFRIITNL